MQEVTSIDSLERQAAAFSLVSTVLRVSPEREWLESIVANEVFEELPYASTQQACLQGQSMLKSWTEHYSEHSLDECYSDHMNLFIGPGKSLAPPWESTYAVNGEGLLFQKETLEVRKWYRAFGLQIDNLYHEPDDHIAYELEFVATLAGQAAEALRTVDTSKGNQLIQAQKEFLETHLLIWAFEWCELMIQKAQTDFYRGIAYLVKGFLSQAQVSLCLKPALEKSVTIA